MVEAGVHPAAYRLFLAGGHYRGHLDFTPAAVDAERTRARAAKDWTRADDIRAELSRGVSVTDTPAGTIWSVP